MVVKPESIAAAYRLRAFWQTATLPDADGRPVNMQGVFTGEVLTELFATLGDMARHHDRHGLCRAVRGPVRGHAGRRDGGIHAQTDARHAACARCAARLSGAQRLVRGQRQHRRGHAGGLLFGCGLSEGAALLMFRQTGIMLSPQLTLAEGSFAAASFALGSLCALFPAYMVYRKTGAVALGDSE